MIGGTILQDTRRPLRTWFTAQSPKKGASAQGLQQVVGVKRYKRAGCIKYGKSWCFQSGKEYLERLKLMKHTRKRGCGTEDKELVAAAVEVKSRKIGRVRMNLIDEVSLRLFSIDPIEKGSDLITNGWPGFSGIENEGYTIKARPKKKTNYYMVISWWKRWLLGTQQGAVSRNHLQAYLDEYGFRFNRRKSAQGGLFFWRLLEHAMNIPLVTWEALLN